MKKAILLIFCVFMASTAYSQNYKKLFKKLLPEKYTVNISKLKNFNHTVAKDSRVHPYVVFYYIKYAESYGTEDAEKYKNLYDAWKNKLSAEKYTYLSEQTRKAKERYGEAKGSQMLSFIGRTKTETSAADPEKLHDNNFADYIFFLFADGKFKERYKDSEDYSEKLADVSTRFNKRTSKLARELEYYQDYHIENFIDETDKKYYMYKGSPESDNLKSLGFEMYVMVNMIIGNKFDPKISIVAGGAYSVLPPSSDLENSWNYTDYRYPNPALGNTITNDLGSQLSVFVGVKYPIKLNKTWFSHINVYAGYTLTKEYDYELAQPAVKEYNVASDDLLYSFRGSFTDEIECSDQLMANLAVSTTLYYITDKIYCDAGLYILYSKYEVTSKTTRTIDEIITIDELHLTNYTPTSVFSNSHLKIFPMVSINWDIFSFVGASFNYMAPAAQNFSLYMRYDL